MRITGAFINAVIILLGGGLGLVFRGKIPERFSENIIRAIGLCVCVIGLSGALAGDMVLLVVSLTLGVFIGELLDIDGSLDRLGRWLQKKISRNDGRSTFSEGFVSATLLFGVGAMAIVGSIDSGLRNDQSVILTKAIIDGVSACVLASALGAGVLFSAAAILVYQGSIEFFAHFLQTILTDALVTQISAAGGVMIMGIGLNLALNARIKVANLLPGFFVAAGYFYLFLSKS
jgi:uncharacterized membrane protein YqgA involved in biofilm formation